MSDRQLLESYIQTVQEPRDLNELAITATVDDLLAQGYRVGLVHDATPITYPSVIAPNTSRIIQRPYLGF